MGVIQHNAVIATTWSREEFARVESWIASTVPTDHRDLFKLTNVVANGYRTIVLCPDGSKEGWRLSDECDKLREKFIVELKRNDYEDGSSPWAYVDISFGEFGVNIEATNQKNLM